MSLKTGAAVIVVLGLLVWGVLENVEASRAKEAAEDHKARAELAMEQRDTALARARRDSLASARQLEQLRVLTEQLEAERDSLGEEVRREEAHHASLADSARALADSAVDEIITRMEEVASAALAGEREISQTLMGENNSLRVTVNTLTAEIGGLRSVIQADSVVIREQATAIRYYERALNPGFLERIVGALPEVGIGAATVLIVVAVAGGL